LFIGREKELSKLNELYNTKVFQFPVIYGRRRVGKTALISEFVKDKDAIFFTGIESSARQNLENFSGSVLSYAGEESADILFRSFQAALEYVFDLSKKRRIVLVIDEYPYVAKADKSLASTIQLLIDKNKDISKLLLFL
jgi:AAA+ ATPase superfamily predicted ATPase